jgi:FkbM family methyltransferase
VVVIASRMSRYLRAGAERVLVAGVRALPARLRTAVREHAVVVRPLDYGATPVVLGVDSLLEYDVRLHSCRKEPGTVRWIEEWIGDGDVLYDVGANVGAYALIAAKARRGKVAVYAFEPSFSNYAQLCRNVALNGCDGTIVPLPVALSDRTVLGGFNHRSFVPGAALHTFGPAIDFKSRAFEPFHTQPVLSYRMDDLVAQFGLPAPNHIKLDVDGLEPGVLAGAERALGDPRLRSVLVELLADSETERTAVAHLERAGLVRHAVERFSLGQDYDGHAYNAVWVRPAARKPL